MPGQGSRAGGYDLIVVGSGAAGLYAAALAAPRGRVALLTKGAIDDGCSRWAQGGIAAAVGSDDSPDLHLQDTLAAGRGLSHPDAVRVLVEDGPDRIRRLMDWGVAFDTQDGELLLAREAAHSRARIVHARGDGTGLEIETALVRRVLGSPVTVIEGACVDRLLLDGDGRCIGVEWREREGDAAHQLRARSVVLATGGAGRLWPRTTNPPPATGDGVALAYAAGAEVAGMEFVQFHPTALSLESAPPFLISEAVRGEGGIVVNRDGRRFLFDADARGELAPRDVVARSIWEELRRSGDDTVLLDCSAIDGMALRFPAIHATCAGYGIDAARQPIPIAPAAHYLIGGVRTDLRGATSVAGLYACGEVASTGVHGANRLASNSLLESVVFAHRAADAALADAAERPLSAEPVAPPPPLRLGGEDALQSAWHRLGSALWDGAGILRDAGGLRAAMSVSEETAELAAAAGSAAGQRLAAAATTATLVCRAALEREETRGCHIRADHPETTDQWHGDLVMQRERGGHLDRHV